MKFFDISRIAPKHKMIFLSLFVGGNFFLTAFWTIRFGPQVQNIFLLVFIFASLGVVFVLWNEKLFSTIIVAAAVFLFTSLMVRIFCAPFYLWNAARLAWIFSLKYGYTLYYPPDTGPILARIYGPFASLMYSPSLIFSSPSWALCSASFLSVLATFFPAFLFLKKESFAFRSSKISFLIGILAFIFFVFLSAPLKMSCFMVHADAPAIGFSGLSCFFLWVGGSRRSRKNLVLSSFFAACALWSKQLVAPLLITLPLYVLVVDGKKVFKEYIFWLIGFLVMLTSIFSFVFGPKNLFFEMFLLPSRHPAASNGDWGVSFLTSFVLLLRESAFFIIFIILCYFRDLRKALVGQEGHLYNKKAWVFLIFIGIFMIPTAVLGRTKQFGDINNFSFCIYFLAIACALGVMKVSERVWNCAQKREKGLIKAFMSVVILSAIQFEMPAFLYEGVQVFSLKDNFQEKAYAFSKKYPGTFYFPDNVLSTLLAEGKMYHTLDGLSDREYAKIPISQGQLNAFIPKKMKRIAMSAQYLWRHGHIKKYFPEYSEETEILIMPDWIFYKKRE